MNKKILSTLLIFIFSAQIIFANTNNLGYDFSDTTAIPIELAIVKKISTKAKIKESDILQFKVKKSVIVDGATILTKGDIITGRIETILTRGLNGFPAEIIIDNFEIPNIKQSQLISTYTKKGWNAFYLVCAIKIPLTVIPFVGSFTNIIRGGHATISPRDTITIYYYPNWK